MGEHIHNKTKTNLKGEERKEQRKYFRNKNPTIKIQQFEKKLHRLKKLIMNYTALVLSLIVCLLHVQAAPVKRQLSTDEEAGNLEVVNRALILTHGESMRPSYSLPNFLIGQKVLCYMYDRHSDFYHSLQDGLRNHSEYSSDTVEEFILKYTDGESITGELSEQLADLASKEYIGREILGRTCRWVQPRSSGFVSSCSVSQISQSCARYRLQEKHEEVVPLFDNYSRAFGVEGRLVGRIANCQWLNPNPNIPQAIIEKINKNGKVDTTDCN